MSPNRLRLGAVWIRDCLRSHSKCAFHTDPLPTLPYRVLDLGPSDGSKDPFLSVGDGRIGRYATLSYRWGDNSAFTTTSGNLAEYQRNISPSTLPKSLQDAIHVTRELNIRFLWIDSLCIVQDSQLDWEQQSAVMSDIYRNSLVTISVNVENAAEDGFLVESESQTYPLSLSCHPRTNIPDRLGDYPRIGDPFAKRVYAYVSGPRSPLRPLGKRAWVLQEQLLTSRTLEFTCDGLTWHCFSNSASETDPTGHKPLGTSHNWNPIAHNTGFSSWRGHPILQYLSWYRAIETYNTRNITYPTGKLPALAGLAKAFQEMMKNDSIENMRRITI